MGRERGPECPGSMGEGEGGRTDFARPEQVGLGGGPNGWMFWPELSGMSATEIFWREEVGLREHIFERVGGSQTGLGDESTSLDLTDESLGISRCFNCGSPEHIVPSCPERRNRALIELSRAIFQFHRESSTRNGGTERFHVVQDWKLQRLQWLQDFEPGEIRGEGLREALELKDGDKGENVPWLYNMLQWGYPPGWASEEDPREAIVRRIVSGVETEDDDDRDQDDFMIFGEAEDKEILTLRPDSGTPTTSTSRSITPEPLTNGAALDHETLREERPVKNFDTRSEVRRWAKYQTPLFSSDLLPVYSGSSLPPVDDDLTYPENNMPLTSRNATKTITIAASSSDTTSASEEEETLHIEPPWRHPDAFSAFGPVGWTTRYSNILARRAQAFREMATYSSEQWSTNTNPNSNTKSSRSHSSQSHLVSEFRTGNEDKGPTLASSTTSERAIDKDGDTLSDDDMDLSD